MHNLDLTSGQAAIAWAGARTKKAALQAAMEFVK